ncbi:MAG TPA: hypothetical protein PKI14_18495 [Fervidobacterium sp.]|nr:hypothetical protein [Fervidobacterium sp.]
MYKFDAHPGYKRYYTYSVWQLEPHKMEEELKRNLPFDGTIYKGELGNIIPILKCLQCECTFVFDPLYPSCPFCEGNAKFKDTGKDIEVRCWPERTLIKYRYFKKDDAIYCIPEGHIKHNTSYFSFLGNINNYIEIPKPYFSLIASYEEPCGTCGYHYYGIYKDQDGGLWELFEDHLSGDDYVKIFKSFGHRWKTIEEAVQTWKRWEEENEIAIFIQE